MEPKVKKRLDAFFSPFAQKSFAKGEIVAAKDTNRGIFFLTKGTVKMTTQPKRRGEFTLNIYKATALFPMSLVFDQEDRHTYRALSKVEGAFAPPKDFAKFVRKNPEILFDLLRRIYRGLDGYFRLLETQLAGSAYFKTLAHLVIYTKRFGKARSGVVTFDWRLTHSQLASQTGLARESVTKEMLKLQKKGLVGYEGKKLFIYDPSKLEEEYRKFPP